MSDLSTLLSPETIRARTAAIYQRALDGQTHFSVNESALEATVALVERVTRANYPTLDIPLHGRFEHLRAGGVDRVAMTASQFRADPLALSRSLIDLVTVSVLLDAGAGMAWRYIESDRPYSKSEGLAVASAAMFAQGTFSDHPQRPLQASALGLQNMTLSTLRHGLQVTEANPVLGLEGRLALVQRLGQCVQSLPHQRPGGLLDLMLAQPQPVSAVFLLRQLLLNFSSVWPARVTCEGVGLGDVWPYEGDGVEHWIPFHKLSQWLTYSLIEPLQLGGVTFCEIERLTGLPEYRNGGLFLDMGVLSLRNAAMASKEHAAGDPLIIEWRALTVQLLDRLAALLRRRLTLSESELPLAKVLQGGTWAAGRIVAKERRVDGGPPLFLQSDGMVF
jgi:Protein of unknown function (DUF1688)